jgi:uncharacterized protein
MASRWTTHVLALVVGVIPAVGLADAPDPKDKAEFVRPIAAASDGSSPGRRIKRRARREQIDIFAAIERGDLARVKAFIEQGVNIDGVDSFGYAPVHAASSNHQDAILSYLIEKGADLNLPDRKGGSTLLHYVAIFNQLAAAEAALAKGASLAIEDSYGNQPLWTAVFEDKGRNDRIKMVKLFMEHGADPDHKNRLGKSPRDFVKLANYDNLRGVLRMD